MKNNYHQIADSLQIVLMASSLLTESDGLTEEKHRKLELIEKNVNLIIDALKNC